MTARAGIMRWAGIALAVYAGLALLLFLFQPHLVFYPQTDRTVEVTPTPAQLGLPFDEVRLKTADGIELHGWHVPVAQPRGTVLLMHGNAGNISHRLDYVAMFHRLGYNTFLFDYRGYGLSGGEPSEQGTYLDAEAAWGFVMQQKQEPACRTVMFGESLGGAVAAWLASRHAPAALIIASSFTSVPDLGQQLYPFLPVRLLSRIQYDTESILPQVAAPVFVAHSPQDDIIPFAHGRALFEAAGSPKQFLELAGGHNDGFIFMRDEWVRAVGAFMEKHTGAGCGR